MGASGQDEPRQQTFHGPGSFGGDNKGVINNVLLDDKTKATLAKLSKDAPELANILKTALRDGVISPDVVTALQSAVQNINHDVADRLWFAAQKINEDVADRLWYAGQNINEEVASKFVRVKNELNETAFNLEQTLSSLRTATAQSSSPQRALNPHSELKPTRVVTGSSRHTVGSTTLTSSQSTGKLGLRFNLICCSSGFGLLTAVILMHHHLGGYATFAGVLALTIPTLFWIIKARR